MVNEDSLFLETTNLALNVILIQSDSPWFMMVHLTCFFLFYEGMQMIPVQWKHTLNFDLLSAAVVL